MPGGGGGDVPETSVAVGWAAGTGSARSSCTIMFGAGAVKLSSMTILWFIFRRRRYKRNWSSSGTPARPYFLQETMSVQGPAVTQEVSSGTERPTRTLYGGRGLDCQKSFDLVWKKVYKAAAVMTRMEIPKGGGEVRGLIRFHV